MIHNNRINNILLAILLVLNVFLLAAFWITRKPGPEKGHPPPPAPKGAKSGLLLKKDLDLSETQFVQLQDIMKTHFAKNDKQHDELRMARDELINLLNDKNAAFQQSEKIGTLETTLAKNLVDHYQELKAICTPEQQKKLEKIFKQSLGRPGPPPQDRR